MATVVNKDGFEPRIEASIPSPKMAREVLKDGVTAPSTVAGAAQIYVDAADGDLKVKFGDGVTKVLAADT